MPKRKVGSIPWTPNKGSKTNSTPTPGSQSLEPQSASTKSLHICTECQKSFEQIRLLRKHTKEVHERNARFQCRQKDCSNRFVRRENRDRHEKTHTQEGYVSCPSCHWKGRADYLEKHLQSKKGQLCRAVPSPTQQPFLVLSSDTLDDWIRDTLCDLGEPSVEGPVAIPDAAPKVYEQDEVVEETWVEDQEQIDEQRCSKPQEAVLCEASDKHNVCQQSDARMPSRGFGIAGAYLLAGIGGWCERFHMQPDSADMQMLLFERDLWRISHNMGFSQLDEDERNQIFTPQEESPPYLASGLERVRVRKFATTNAFNLRAIQSGEAHSASWAPMPCQIDTQEFEMITTFQADMGTSTPDTPGTMEQRPNNFAVPFNPRTGETSIERAMRNFQELRDDIGSRCVRTLPSKTFVTSGETALTCKICGSRTKPSRSAVLAHAQSHSKTRPTATHRCGICGLRFLFKRDWLLHTTKPGVFRSTNECYPSAPHDDEDQIAKCVAEDLRVFEQQVRRWESFQLRQYFRALVLALCDGTGHQAQRRGCASLPLISMARRAKRAEAGTVVMSDCAAGTLQDDKLVDGVTDQFATLLVTSMQVPNTHVAEQAAPAHTRHARVRA